MLRPSPNHGTQRLPNDDDDDDDEKNKIKSYQKYLIKSGFAKLME